MTRYFDRDGSPMTLIEWATKFESQSARRVAEDYIGDVHISTVWLGLDHAFFGGAPLIFETMIVGGPHDQFQDRYSTEAQALEGHANALKLAGGV